MAPTIRLAQRMLTLMVASALAAEAAPDPERLEGVHLGLGMSFYLVTTSATDVELPTGLVGRSSVSARLRLGPSFTLAPSVRVSSGQASAGKRIDGEDQEPEEEYTYLSLSAGVDARLRVAHHQRMDLIGIVGVFAENKSQEVQPTGESTEPIRTEGFGGSLEFGVGVEYWINPEISVGADVSATVLSATRLQDDDVYEDSLWFGLSPNSGASLTFYF